MDPTRRDPFLPGLLQRLDWAAPRKVAIVRASRIGDFICATPAFRALRLALPAAHLTLIGLPIVADLARRLASLDRFAPFPGFPGIADQFFEARRTLEFLAAMQAERFDLAIQLHGSGVYSNPFTLMLGARVTAGMVRPGDPAGGLDAAFPVSPDGHEVNRLLSFTSFLGAGASRPRVELGLEAEDLAGADACLAPAARPLIGVHPGAREATKRWPAADFAAAAERLRRERGGTVVIVGGPDEIEAAGEIERRIPGRCLSLAGRVSLPVMAAVVGRLSVLLTNDSAPAHMAYALGTPSVTIFGGTEPARWGPPDGSRHVALFRDVPCRPCQGDQCPHGFACLAAIRPSDLVGVTPFGP